MKKTKMVCIFTAALFLTAIGTVSCRGTADSHKGKNEVVTNSKNPAAKRQRPLMGGYYRNWHDKGSYEGAANRMSDVPKEVDILFVFDDYTPQDKPFWQKDIKGYIPKLNEQGTQVVRTIGFEFIIGERGILKDKSYNIADGKKHMEMAQKLVDEYVTKHGMNGLDIDIERHNFSRKSAAMQENGIKILLELAKLIGPKGKDKTKLFIIDTNFCAGNPIIPELAAYIDFLLLQAYGSYGERSLNANWNAIKSDIKPEQFMVGFSFYEEGDTNYWGDIAGAVGESIKGTRAKRYADWQPNDGKEGQKAGVFSYAIDRDGVKNGDNTKYIKTAYKWTKWLKQRMLNARNAH